MGKVKFERLTLQNIQTINKIIIDDEVYEKENIEKFISNNENYIFVGKDNDKVIAILYGYGLYRPDNKNMFYIHSVDVIDEYQGKGIGTQLIEFVLSYIKDENKYYKYWVLADIDNIRANRLYQKYADKKEQNLFDKRI